MILLVMNEAWIDQVFSDSLAVIMPLKCRSEENTQSAMKHHSNTDIRTAFRENRYSSQ